MRINLEFLYSFVDDGIESAVLSKDGEEVIFPLKFLPEGKNLEEGDIIIFNMVPDLKSRESVESGGFVKNPQRQILR